MGRWLLRFDGTFSTGAWVAVAALVAGGFGFGFVARSIAGGTSDAARPVAQGRIEADVPARAAERGPALRAAAALPGLATRPPAHRHRARPRPTPEPTTTAEPVSTPLATPTPSATPAATAAPPPPRPTPPPPRPTPAGTTFDSSG